MYFTNKIDQNVYNGYYANVLFFLNSAVLKFSAICYKIGDKGDSCIHSQIAEVWCVIGTTFITTEGERGKWDLFSLRQWRVLGPATCTMVVWDLAGLPWFHRGEITAHILMLRLPTGALVSLSQLEVALCTCLRIVVKIISLLENRRLISGMKVNAQRPQDPLQLSGDHQMP